MNEMAEMNRSKDEITLSQLSQISFRLFNGSPGVGRMTTIVASFFFCFIIPSQFLSHLKEEIALIFVHLILILVYCVEKKT